MFDENRDAPRSHGARARQKQATAKAVLDAARAEFERVGYEKANLRGIAARAGVSAGTVVHHFGDKRELLHAAFFDDLERTLHRALDRPRPGPLADQLSALTRAVFRYYTKRPKLSRTLLKESLFAEPPWAERFNGQVEQVHDAVAQLAQAAINSGELRPDTNCAVLAAAYLSFFYFALLGWAQGAHGRPVALVTGLIDQHLQGLRPPPRPARRSRR